MADRQQKEMNKIDVKRWQHCSLFNLDLFNDEHHQNSNINRDITSHTNTDACCCSTSTPNVDDTLRKKHLNHSCPFTVLQKNYTTQLEHVAEKLLATNDDSAIEDCYYCSTYETNDTKVQSLNRKILLGSTALLDNFLRNNLKTSLLPNLNSSPPPTTNMNLTSTIVASTSNPRRWHSERASRPTNVCANLPLSVAQRQVLEHYRNYPIIKPTMYVRSNHRSHRHHQPVTGKVIENTGTALSTLNEQFLNTANTSSTSAHNRKASTSINPIHSRSILTTTNISHNTTSNRHCFLVDAIVHSKSKDDSEHEHINENESVSSETDRPGDEENHQLNQISILSNSLNHHLNISEVLLECAICCELKRLQKRTCCSFYICSNCLTNYVEQQIKQGIIRIQCPNQNCHMYMHCDEIYQRCTSSEVRHKFTSLLIDNNRSINIKTCPRCSNIHEIDLELCRSMKRAPTKVQCTECNLIWCFQCHSPWHDGIQCKEFRRGDRMLKKWAREVHYGQHNAQQCPCCKVYIQRTKGCDHIVCLRCKTEFCYKCGGRFRDIKFIGDHYSELSVLGCKYRFYPDNPVKRRLIRGSILGGKVLAAPVVLCLAVVAGVVCLGVGLPAYGCLTLVRKIKAKHRKHRHAALKEPVLLSYKSLNDMVPQLIPRDPVNMNGVKPGFNTIRSNNTTVEIDLTNDAPIVVFDECDIHVSTKQNDSAKK